ncbi:MAG: hypothetical protein ACRYFU_10635 [Janthinobacterium lividum]
MKIFWIVLGILVLGFATFALVNYLLQRKRQQRAQDEGVVVYASVVLVEAIGGWMKELAMKKIVLSLQEPGSAAPREVTLRTRIQPGQKIFRGMRLAVAVDPKDPRHVYPASPEAAERLVLTGSRMERRLMKAQSAGTRPRVQGAQRPPRPIPGLRERR